MPDPLRISIYTSVYNGADLLPETIESVLNQTYPHFDYTILDAGSTDGSQEVIRRYEDRLAHWQSEPDNGLYDGLAKGLPQATGDIVCYLNAGDLLHPRAFEIVAETFQDPDVSWIMGLIAVVNHKGHALDSYFACPHYPRMILVGAHGRELNFIQQEATFWRRDLHRTVDWTHFAGLRLAGDAYLWHCFAGVEQLYSIPVVLGYFRIHPGQLSEDLSGYRAELAEISAPRRLRDWAQIAFAMFLRLAPPKIRHLFNHRYRLHFDATDGVWRRYRP